MCENRRRAYYKQKFNIQENQRIAVKRFFFGYCRIRVMILRMKVKY